MFDFSFVWYFLVIKPVMMIFQTLYIAESGSHKGILVASFSIPWYPLWSPRSRQESSGTPFTFLPMTHWGPGSQTFGQRSQLFLLSSTPRLTDHNPGHYHYQSLRFFSALVWLNHLLMSPNIFYCSSQLWMIIIYPQISPLSPFHHCLQLINFSLVFVIVCFGTLQSSTTQRGENNWDILTLWLLCRVYLWPGLILRKSHIWSLEIICMASPIQCTQTLDHAGNYKHDTFWNLRWCAVWRIQEINPLLIYWYKGVW